MITTTHASNSHVTVVTLKRFTVLIFLSSFCVNSLMIHLRQYFNWPQKREFHLWLFLSFISRYGSSGQTANSSGNQYQPYNKPKTKQYKDRRASPRGQQQQQDIGKKHGRKTPETDRTTNEQWGTLDKEFLMCMLFTWNNDRLLLIF